MGEMILRNLDDGLLVELREMAIRRGLETDALALELLRSAVRTRKEGRAAGARAILAAQPTVARRDSVDLIREDRNRE